MDLETPHILSSTLTRKVREKTDMQRQISLIVLIIGFLYGELKFLTVEEMMTYSWLSLLLLLLLLLWWW